jgi:hypothetical protein
MLILDAILRPYGRQTESAYHLAPKMFELALLHLGAALHSNSASKDNLYTASTPASGRGESALPHQHYSMGAPNINYEIDEI